MPSSSKKWTVYRRGEAIGTFTAAEIREQLRNGALSPNDFAAAEGSKLQLEIIEIDEIFAGSEPADDFFPDAPRRSRWAKRAEEIGMQEAPATRPSPERLRAQAASQSRPKIRARGRMPALPATTGKPKEPMDFATLAVWAIVTAGLTLAVAWYLKLSIDLPRPKD